MRIVLLGAPGSGKGTQGQLMAVRHRIPLISTGELLHQATVAGTPLGRQARAYMDAGQMVPDELMLGVIRERLGSADTRNGFILDGFPRSIAQAEALDKLLAELDRPVQLALLFDVDVDVLMQRLGGRRVCNHCGQVYNVYTSPPKMDGRCDECGHTLRHRADDSEETIGNRLRIYETQTLPVIDYYRNQTKLRRIQGVGDPEHIFSAVKKILDALKKSAAHERARKDEAQGKAQVATGKKTKKTAAAKPATAVKKKATKKKATKKKVAKKTAKKKTAGKAVSKKAAVPARKKAAKKTAKKATAGGRKAAVPARKKAAKKAVKKKAVKKKAVKKKAVKKKAVKKKAVKKKAVKKKTAASGKKAATKKTAKKKAAGKAASRKKAPGRKKAATRAKKASKKVAGRKQPAARRKAGKRR